MQQIQNVRAGKESTGKPEVVDARVLVRNSFDKPYGPCSERTFPPKESGEG